MKHFLVYLFLSLFPLSLLAGQNDFDGTWNVDVACSSDSYYPLRSPAYSYKEVWDIKNNTINKVSNKKDNFINSQTTWRGYINNQNLLITAEGVDFGYKSAWTWKGGGQISSPDFFLINAEIFRKNGEKSRDCTLKFTSLEPAVGSLANLKTRAQKNISNPSSSSRIDGSPPVSPDIKSSSLTPQPVAQTQVANSVDAPKVVAPPANLAKEVKPSVDSLSNARQATDPKTVKMPASEQEANTKSEAKGPNSFWYLISSGGMLLIALIIYFVTRNGRRAVAEAESLKKKAKEELADVQALKKTVEAEATAIKKRVEEEQNSIAAMREAAFVKQKAERELAQAQAIKEASLLKQQAERELAQAQAMRAALEAEAASKLEAERAAKRAEAAAKRMIEEAKIAKELALKDALARKQKAEEDLESLKRDSSSATPEVFRTKFCTKCGVEIKPNSKFCTGCGTQQ